MRRLELELRDTSCERLIISGEDISLLDSDEKLRLLDFFSSRNVAVKVIVYVRSPLNYVVSYTQQKIKTGRSSLPPNRLNYEDKIGPFLERLSDENISVFDYDSIVKSNIDIVTHFSEVAGLNLPETVRQNTSLQPGQLALLFKLNSMKAMRTAHGIGFRPNLRVCPPTDLEVI